VLVKVSLVSGQQSVLLDRTVTCVLLPLAKSSPTSDTVAVTSPRTPRVLSFRAGNAISSPRNPTNRPILSQTVDVYGESNTLSTKLSNRQSVLERETESQAINRALHAHLHGIEPRADTSLYDTRAFRTDATAAIRFSSSLPLHSSTVTLPGASSTTSDDVSRRPERQLLYLRCVGTVVPLEHVQSNWYSTAAEVKSNYIMRTSTPPTTATTVVADEKHAAGMASNRPASSLVRDRFACSAKAIQCALQELIGGVPVDQALTDLPESQHPYFIQLLRQDTVQRKDGYALRLKGVGDAIASAHEVQNGAGGQAAQDGSWSLALAQQGLTTRVA